MRIPLSKVYRAFPELDRFSDQQCELLMKRVQLQQGTTVGITFLVLVACIVLAVGLLIITQVALSLMALPVDVANRHEQTILRVGFIVVMVPPAAMGVVLRDSILRRRLTRALDYEIDRVRCLSCKYILIGQVASAGRIDCPECGSSFALNQLGITEDDLLPPSNLSGPMQG